VRLGYILLDAAAFRSDNSTQQFDFGTPGMKPWTEQDHFWQRLEGPNQVCRHFSNGILPATHSQQYPDYSGAQSLVEDYLAKIDGLAQEFVCLVAECLSLPLETFDGFKGNMSRLKFVNIHLQRKIPKELARIRTRRVFLLSCPKTIQEGYRC
jgi:hypothetical protein